MERLSLTDFYVVIRSAGERSLPLCQRSVEINGLDYETIKVSPFWKAVLSTFEIGIRKKRAYTIGLDADIILKKNAIKIICQNLRQSSNYWKYDFRLQDRFYPRPIAGVHVYQTAILPLSLNHQPQNLKKIPKPEREFCYQLKKIGYNDICINQVIGRHGYDQYYRDIYQRFRHRAVRNPEDKRQLFDRYRYPNSNDPELLVAYLGWLDGEKTLRNLAIKQQIEKIILGKKISGRIFFPPDARKKKNISKLLSKYRLTELQPVICPRNN